MEKSEQDRLLDYYKLCIDQLKSYNALIWQLPTALITLNILTFKFFNSQLSVLFILIFINFSMLYALHCHIKNSKAIIASTVRVEEKLNEYFNDLLPEFHIPFVKATTVIQMTLLIINICLILYVICDILNGQN